MAKDKVDLKDLSPVDYNPRTIGKDEMRRLQSSIREHTVATENWDLNKGFRLASTITVNRKGNRIVGGHQRVTALSGLGQDWIHPDDITWVSLEPGSAQEKALNVSLNNDQATGAFDDDLLQGLMKDIEEEAEDLLTALEFDSLIKSVSDEPTSNGGKTEDDSTPEAEKGKPRSQVGEIYQLGEHRVLCGDACEVGAYEKLLNGVKVEMLFTDPPYGVGYEGGVFHSEKPNKKHKRKKLVADETSEVYSKFLPLVLGHVDGPCYVWTSNKTAADTLIAVRGTKSDIHSLIIWHKINATYAAMNANYKERHELCVYFKPVGSTLRWCGPTNERTIWEIERSARNNWHPTQKPVVLAERALNNHEAKTVLDCFAGSGSTVIAAEKLGRVCYAIEIDPIYVDVIRRRYAEFKKGEGCKWEEFTPVVKEEVIV